MEKPSSQIIQTCQLEYEAQLFDHTAQTITDEVYNIMYDYTFDTVKSVYEYMTSKYKDIDKDVIKKGSEALRSEIVSQAESICDALEAELSQTIMKIPDDVVLTEDAKQLDTTLTEERQLDEELEQLRISIDKEIMTYQSLSSQKKNLQSLIAAHRQAQEIHSENVASIDLTALPKIIPKINAKVNYFVSKSE